ncbi:MAG: type II/IV secretion system protein [Candidatus Eisenbacteria bacterium]|nr:type II/IV secretion system protein [Candidatus Eisenbacteria bacterium]
MARPELQGNTPALDLKRVLPDPEAVKLVPRAAAVRYTVAPLALEGDALRVALRDVHDIDALDYLEMLTQRRVIAVAAPEPELREFIQRVYTGAGGGGELDTVVAEASRLAQEKSDGSELPIIRLVDLLLAEALRQRATDLHVQPEHSGLVLRFRVDGLLRLVLTLPKELQLPIATRLKVMADLDISERRLPQDGKIDLSVGERRIDLRVSTLPTVHGENIVLRLLDHARVLHGFPDLGFHAEDIERLVAMSARPHGIFLVTGPTGSGKTTTLYAALQCVDTAERNVLTLEDPVEYRLPGIRQSHIQEKTGFTFATGLRAALRQDPDVILVGEIRDLETAEIAVRAALTGHLVLSTLHTMSAPGTIARLREMGIADYLLASTLSGILAQRLVRRLCDCATDRSATTAERAYLGCRTES